jgi:hypothetical protein
LPVASIATPVGPANWPLPEPEVPHAKRKAPLASNFWMRVLFVSAT